MKLVHIIGGGVFMMVGGMFLAWTLDDRSVEASVPTTDTVTAAPKATTVADNVIAVPEGDPDMDDALVAARATFDRFWQRVSADKTGLDAISIKAGIAHADGTEHLWMTGCTSVDVQYFVCIVSNKPEVVPLTLGSKYGFDRSVISDWMYRQDGKIHGGYSIRALLPSMEPEQAEQMAAMLAPLP